MKLFPSVMDLACHAEEQPVPHGGKASLRRIKDTMMQEEDQLSFKVCFFIGSNRFTAQSKDPSAACTEATKYQGDNVRDFIDC